MAQNETSHYEDIPFENLSLTHPFLNTTELSDRLFLEGSSVSPPYPAISGDSSTSQDKNGTYARLDTTLPQEDGGDSDAPPDCEKSDLDIYPRPKKDSVAKKQATRQFLDGLRWWLMTTVLLVALYLVVHVYKSKNVLDKNQSHIFNAATTGISIALGMSVASSFKAMVASVRWRVLSQRPRPLSEIDLYLQGESLRALIKIAYTTLRPGAILTCFLIIALNVGAQIGIATIALTWSIEPTTDYALIKDHSLVWITELSYFGTVNDKQPDTFSEKQIVHELGGIANDYRSCTLGVDEGCDLPKPQETFLSVGMDYWFNAETQEWLYIYLDVPPSDSDPDRGPFGISDLSLYSQRRITVSATCQATAATVNQTSYDWTNNTSGEIIPNSVTLSNSTTWRMNANVTCNGSKRTAYMTGFEFGDFSNDSVLAPAWVYKCCNSVSHLTSFPGGNQSYQMPDSTAHLAAGAIVWKGYTDDAIGFDNSAYYTDTYFGTPQNGDNTTMAKLVSQYTIGVFASSGYFSPKINLSDAGQPYEGQHVTLDHGDLFLMACILITGVQFLLLILSIALTYRIAIPDESPITMAYRLRPLLRGIGSEGALIDVKELAEDSDVTTAIYAILPSEEDGKHRATFVPGNVFQSTQSGS